MRKRPLRPRRISFERLLARSGPELFWEVDAGVAAPRQLVVLSTTRLTAAVEMPGDRICVFQSSTGKFFLDRNGNRATD